MAADNSGPAFPAPAIPDSGKGVGPFPADASQGMSLRDWFAGQSLIGLLSSGTEPPSMTVANFATLAYDYADAMLQARQEEGG